jgi:hypothetical protein
MMPDADEYPISVFAAVPPRPELRQIVVAAQTEVRATAVRVLPPENIIEAAKAGYAGDAHMAFHMDLVRQGKSNAGFYVDGGLLFFDDIVDGPLMCVLKGEALNLLLHAARHDANSHVGWRKTFGSLRHFYVTDATR